MQHPRKENIYHLSILLSFLAVFALFWVFCPLTGRPIACLLPT